MLGFMVNTAFFIVKATFIAIGGVIIGSVAFTALLALFYTYAKYKLKILPPAPKKITLSDGKILEGPEKQLGKGGFGTVLKYRLNGNSVAVKIPNNQREFEEAQQREITLIRKASPHKNIITILATPVIEQCTWLIMEFMDGSVRDLLDANPGLPLKTRLSIATQMAEGVAYLHNLTGASFSRAAIVHQDLKTDNLLVKWNGVTTEVKIADFGIAREVDQIRLPFFGTVLSSKLYKGKQNGSLLYMAPEVVSAIFNDKDSCDPKSDVFSMGFILWELATTRRPNRNINQVMAGSFPEFQNDKIVITSTNTTFLGITFKKSEPKYLESAPFGAVIEKCVQKDPKDRDSARQVSETLQEIERSQRQLTG